MKTVQLKPICESIEDIDAIEKAIRIFFKKEIYIPLLKELGAPATLKNTLSDLLEAVRSGRLTFYRGRFSGKLSSTLTQELKRMGAQWDRRQGSFSIPHSKLPIEVKEAISVSQARFDQVVVTIDRRLKQFLPAEIARRIDVTPLFEKTLFKTEKKFQDSIQGISVSPKLSKEAVKRISDEYTTNLQLHIQEFTEKEIEALRTSIATRSIQGQRYESIVGEIKRSYGVSSSKAKFLARQETNLFVTKFKQVRYQDAGINDYVWCCVSGSPKHPVRPMHKMLEGKTFSWNAPPIVNPKGERKNPGQDYGCRCFARPIVRF